MANTPQGKGTFQAISAEARALGEELARLLLDSPLPAEQKKAWAALLPYMTIEQLGKLREMLLGHLERQVFDEAEDIILSMKAEELKRQFADAHNVHDAHTSLDAIEKEIDALEGAV